MFSHNRHENISWKNIGSPSAAHCFQNIMVGQTVMFKRRLCPAKKSTQTTFKVLLEIASDPYLQIRVFHNTPFFDLSYVLLTSHAMQMP